MYEYGIRHIHCGMNTVIFGYDFADACRRSGTDPQLWEIEYSDYVD